MMLSDVCLSIAYIVSESRVTWATCMPILVFLGLSVSPWSTVVVDGWNVAGDDDPKSSRRTVSAAANHSGKGANATAAPRGGEM